MFKISHNFWSFEISGADDYSKYPRKNKGLCYNVCISIPGIVISTLNLNRKPEGIGHSPRLCLSCGILYH